MKDMLQIMLVCMVLAMMLVFTNPRAAEADNDALKACLALHDYSPEKFDTFNWNAASACYHEHLILQEESKRAEIKEFLKEKPWYKGANWQWETRAEYTCVKRYDLNGIEICSKPFYLN
jgi:hypothetical protein